MGHLGAPSQIEIGATVKYYYKRKQHFGKLVELLATVQHPKGRKVTVPLTDVEDWSRR